MASASSALTIEGLQTFLARSKRLSIDPALDLSRTLLVLGNESGDVDSIVASIVTAFASSELDRLPSDRVAFIPVLNLKREDLALRPETLHLFDMLGIAAAELVFVDEFATVFGSSSSAEALAGLQVVLVDHNQLIASQLHLAPFVTLVLDHHARQECPDDAAQLPNARRLVIETVGSACTLVAEYACQLLPSTSAAVFDSGIATLLLAAILLDTFNLDAKAKRATEKDHSYGRLLGAVLASSENPTDIEAAHKRLFLQLQHAKEQIDHLSSRDLLRKDYKEWRTLSFGIASVPCSLESWKTRDTALNTALVAYAQERHLEVLFVMFLYTDSEVRRQLSIVARDAQAVQGIVAFLHQQHIELQLLHQDHCDTPTPPFVLHHYQQLATTIARKNLSPLLEQYFSSLA